MFPNKPLVINVIRKHTQGQPDLPLRLHCSSSSSFCFDPTAPPLFEFGERKLHIHVTHVQPGGGSLDHQILSVLLLQPLQTKAATSLLLGLEWLVALHTLKHTNAGEEDRSMTSG